MMNIVEPQIYRYFDMALKYAETFRIRMIQHSNRFDRICHLCVLIKVNWVVQKIPKILRDNRSEYSKHFRFEVYGTGIQNTIEFDDDVFIEDNVQR